MNKKNKSFNKSLPVDEDKNNKSSASSENAIEFRQIIETMPVMTYVAEPYPPHAPIYISPAFEDFGYSLDEWRENEDFWIQAIHAEDRERILQETEKAMKSGGKTDFEYRIVAKDGSVHWVRDRGCFIRDTMGNPICWQGIILDVTRSKHTEQELSALFEAMTDVIVVLDRHGRYLKITPTNAPLLYRPPEELTGKTLEENFPSEQVEMILKFVRIALETKQTQKFEYRLPFDGHDIWFVATVSPMTADSVVLVARDITESKNAEEALRESEARYRSLGEGIMHQVWTAQPDGRFNYVNGRMLTYLGCTFEQVLGEGWKNCIHSEDLPETIARWKHSLETGDDCEMEFRLKRFDGKYRWHQARATAGYDYEGKIVNWYGTNTDIDDRKIAEAKLNHFAGRDTLTNLPNRAKFMNHLERAIRRSEFNPAYRFAVLFLDLDRFKVINDTLGHLVGDKLLIAISERLQSSIRPNDIVARLGGDEFTVLLSGINEPADAARVANRFLEKLSEPFNLDTYEVFTSASIGIIVSDEVRRQPENFLRDADTAMYRAKAAGKARYEIFDREMHIRNMNLLQLESDLRRAIELNEFRVFYQPIIELDTGEIREFEALIRWQYSKHGLVMPNDFISIAEETGLIIPIGRWVLREACRQAVEWQKTFPAMEKLSISVNLSAKQLLHPNLSTQIEEILKQTALNPRCLKLEVTESMVMENGDKALSAISELRSLGISISTDDFGTGYSSLNYLHRFPFNRLKIDRSLVNKMDVDQNCEAIVRTILLLGQNLNLEVVAEGIETEQQLINLRQFGCLGGQGYLFSKPVDADSAARLLRDGLPGNFGEYFSCGKSGGRQLIELDEIQ
jgi:diguanylate cyclase (GGDEF)-like protein/PAS domain S-box-containing protein